MPYLENQGSNEASTTSLRSGLEHARRQLLDLGLRNNLLNYRLLKSRGVDTSTSNPDELFSALVTGNRQIRVTAISKEDQVSGNAVRREVTASPTTLIMTGDDAELELRLLNSHDHARVSMEEQGLNTLFLALGMLEWYEDESSNRARYSPLILVPVELTRRDATSRFVVTYSGEEIGSNLSLEAKLQTEFSLSLPVFDPEDGTVLRYFAAFEDAVSGRPRWTVDSERVALGHFSFNKFQMYHDLNPDEWPGTTPMLDHPVLQGLLSPNGFHSQLSNYSEQQFLDDVVSEVDHRMVVDADSSQTLALLDAIDGRSMVIQGPPGTGKSQTITNLIALAIGQGKRVLFVAEKMAALEVVKRRLDQLGLGVACLELHGTKTRKRRVLDDLNETLGLGEPNLVNDLDNRARLGATRVWLNEYCRALSTPVGHSGISAYRALGEVVRIRDEAPVDQWPPLELNDVSGWDSEMLHQRTALVAELQMTRRQVGDPRSHPFLGVRRSELGPVDMENLRSSLQNALDALLQVYQRSRDVWSLLEQHPKLSPAGIETAVATGKRAETVEAQGDIRYANPAWIDQSDEIESLLSDGKTAAELNARHQGSVTPETWDADLEEYVETMQQYRRSVFRWFSPAYWNMRGRLTKYMTDDAPDEQWARVDLLVEIQRYQQLLAAIEQRDCFGKFMFRDHWKGIDSDWEHLGRMSSSAIALHQDIQQNGLNSALLDALDRGVNREELARLAELLRQEAGAAREAVQGVCQSLEFEKAEHSSATAPPMEDWSIAEQTELIRWWRSSIGLVNQWVAFRRSLQSCYQLDMPSVAELGWNWGEAGEQLENLFRYRTHLQLLDHAWKTHPVLGTTGSGNKDFWRQEFSRLDQNQLRWNQALLAQKHWEELPRSGGGGELRTLATEIQKKRRNLPIRKLMQRAGNAVQAVKPVFMMSPLSVANFIPPGSLHFDIVVFDEASQVQPVDAFGAILRGQQSIVVGDDQQLPPTDFFQRSIEEDDVDDEQIVSPGDMQSILNLFIAQNAPQRMLRWHYRSQHESLIAVSNREFYDNRLIVFPSPSRDSGELGLRFHHLSNTVYDRGRSKTNQEEARSVAAAVMEHAHEDPELTLGVAAFSKSQADAIRDHLETLRRDDSSVEPFFTENSAEPFFIKSLENVQGDERDVIFISVGYGRDETGRVTNNFGPVNNEGGERRLNVLFTRSRRRCEVFTNITDEDISAGSTSRGVQALRTFLHYARRDEFPISTSIGGETQSPFEAAVQRALESAGYEVHVQVGSAGYFIDLAVVHPEKPGNYLLAIECDGASYHSARSSRDRDRLRQQVLEGLGWRFHRIWSTDWFAAPKEELKRTVAAIEGARGGAAELSPPTKQSTQGDWTIVRHEPVPVADPTGDVGLPQYEFAEPVLDARAEGFESIDEKSIAEVVLEIADIEGPVHESIVYRRVTHAAGLKRTGSRIKARIDSVVEILDRAKWLTRRGEFIWPRGMVDPPIRSRGLLDQTERKLELIAPEELDGIILDVVRRSFSISRPETGRMVIRSLGMQRSGQNAVSIVEQRIRELLETGRLNEQNSKLTAPE